MKCQTTKNNGQKCGSHAVVGGHFCYFHDPAIPKETKQLARKRGGKHNRPRVDIALSEIKVSAPCDVVRLLSQTISEVRKGEVDVRIANCIGFLSGHLIRAFEATDTEERLVELEEQINQIGSRPYPHK